MQYRLSRQAQTTLEAIADYTTENFGSRQTSEYLGGFRRSFEFLLDNPRLGQTWHGEVRRFNYRSHYVFYQINDDEIFITAIRNTRQAPASDDEF